MILGVHKILGNIYQPTLKTKILNLKKKLMGFLVDVSPFRFGGVSLGFMLVPFSG